MCASPQRACAATRAGNCKAWLSELGSFWPPIPRIPAAAAIVAAIAGVGLSARAAGGMDPGYPEILAEAERAVGRAVDWTMRVERVEKRFYTYKLTGVYLPDPGEDPCSGCRLVVIFRARPEETARPPRFKPGQALTLRGTVLRIDPQPVILAATIR
jgi:hypothetical protein